MGHWATPSPSPREVPVVYGRSSGGKSSRLVYPILFNTTGEAGGHGICKIMGDRRGAHHHHQMDQSGSVRLSASFLCQLGGFSSVGKVVLRSDGLATLIAINVCKTLNNFFFFQNFGLRKFFEFCIGRGRSARGSVHDRSWTEPLPYIKQVSACPTGICSPSDQEKL